MSYYKLFCYNNVLLSQFLLVTIISSFILASGLLVSYLLINTPSNNVVPTPTSFRGASNLYKGTHTSSFWNIVLYSPLICLLCYFLCLMFQLLSVFFHSHHLKHWVHKVTPCFYKFLLCPYVHWIGHFNLLIFHFYPLLSSSLLCSRNLCKSDDPFLPNNIIALPA